MLQDVSTWHWNGILKLSHLIPLSPGPWTALSSSEPGKNCLYFTQHLDCPSVQTVKIYAVKYVTNKMPLSCQSIENEFMVVVSSFSCNYFCKNWHPLLGWALRTQSLIYMFNSIRADAHCLVNPTYLSLSINDGKNKIDWLRDKPISLFWSTADDVTNNEEDDDEEEVIEKWEESGKIKMSTLVQCWLYILVI